MYSFYFGAEGEDPFCLPIAPGALKKNAPGKNKVIELIATGEYNILKSPGLKSFSFEVLLPGKEYPFAEYREGFQAPDFYLNKFEEFMTNRKYIVFTVARVKPNKEQIPGESILVSLENYTAKENAGEEGDFYVELSLKEYREPIPITQEVQSIEPDGTPVVEETVQRPAKEPAKEYAVKSGDTLWAIAKRELNDGSLYQKIADLNGIKDPSRITSGQVLKLPQKG